MLIKRIRTNGGKVVILAHTSCPGVNLPNVKPFVLFGLHFCSGVLQDWKEGSGCMLQYQALQQHKVGVKYKYFLTELTFQYQFQRLLGVFSISGMIRAHIAPTAAF